ncbi:LysE family translocator [Marinobacter sp. CHS3-4]|uniref:LysE family translocator n=1 Tax=Marinobacter sp. CHS3-4 TaxID=3045174 RepID=UPI0024B6077E|nr:LysE family translocator [Marinobacter sp. CHS3-4]MDI9244781.1 LysE family translocator [Marinobacter sp. CHS3-4]
MEILLSVLLFALVSTATPGPNNIMVMTSGMNFGVWRTLPHYLGICIGFPAMVLGVSLGLGTLFEAVPVMHQLIKVLGISYLMYLAWRIATTATEVTQDDTSRPLSFWQAAAFQWVNPKAWVMAVGALATFTTVSGEVVYQAFWIAAAFMVVAIPSVGSWMLGGAGLRRLLQKPAYRRWFNWIMGLLLALSVIPMVSVELAEVL